MVIALVCSFVSFVGDDHKSRHSKNRAEESEGSEEDSDAEDRPRKRGRPPKLARDSIKGFNDSEIRRFMKSFRKFPTPLERLDAVAGDAELQEKPLAELTKLGEMILQRSQEALLSQKSGAASEAVDEGPAPTGRKKRERGPSFKISNVSVNAKTLMACLNELEPLSHLLPSNHEERRRWVLNTRVRDPHWDIEWTPEDDSRLLCGIYEFGMGSWEAMKMDPNLGLSDKILPDGQDARPQGKHLQNRADYLLKILAKIYEQQQGKPKPQRARKAREPKVAAAPAKPSMETEDITSDDDLSVPNSVAPSRVRIPKPKAHAKVKTEDEDSHDVRTEDEKLVDKERKKEKSDSKKKKKKDTGPMHFTANSEPRAVDIIGDLDPAIFNEVGYVLKIF